MPGFGGFLGRFGWVFFSEQIDGGSPVEFFFSGISVYEDLFITVSLFDGYSSCFTSVF